METRAEMDILIPEEFKPLWEQNEQRPVVKYPASALRVVAEPVERVGKATRELIDMLKSVMKKANGIGLAAPQMGISKRVLVMSDGRKTIGLVNPVIVQSEGSIVGEEGCLSLPGLYGEVQRHAIVEVEALDEEGRSVRLRMEGLAARCVQHEIDHLDGVLFIDRADLNTLHWAWPATADTGK